MYERKLLGVFVWVGVGLVAAAFGSAAFFIARDGDPFRSEAKAEFRSAIADDLYAAYSYNAYFLQVTASAPDAMSNTVAGAWENCALIGIRWIGGQPVPDYPTEHELDVCEASAVRLATSRGYDATAASRYAQQLRATSAVLRARN
ncbi:hypothetical protein R1015_22935 (plasmid) [Citrobacter koseri]|uniref:Uncharacterized protein n=1 Tax=Serratia marcescens TaxID=615 RepID=A0A7G1HHP0_SERMA|nr:MULTISPECIES: hypothetical protein [Enterobacterales]WOJ24245.1 hypothetical protein R1015_22935 [Citrobacter koseri]BCD58838.1 hypothetical protein [Serratia marcescens]BCD58882.1 hypothetical protein [Serratia marcescens]HBD0494313.1 hypothetical protein [Escherichia coli]